MFLKRKFDLIFLLIALAFSIWFFYKSFGYEGNGNYYVARHEIGDFGLHLSLIRSFSIGDNLPAELPFYPGKPLVYHYFFDFFVGMLEQAGLRIDIAFNGLSIICFTMLLYFIYKLPQVIFEKNPFLGLLSVILFLFHSSFTFIDFLKLQKISSSTISALWYLPDYIHKGPFDGSLISIFFTPAVFLNQRHLVAACVLALGIYYFLLPKLLAKKEKTLWWQLFLIGISIGLLSGVHTLIFLSLLIILFSQFLLFRKYRFIPYIFLPALAIFAFRAKDLAGQNLVHPFLHFGFLAKPPLTPFTFLEFWILNLGIAFFLIPIGVFLATKRQKLIFVSVFSLFLIGNIFQLSFRIDHNHSLFNFFLIFANFYIAFFLIWLWEKKPFAKILTCVFLIILIASGVLDMMAVKNDFRYPLALDNKPFTYWLKNNTSSKDILLGKEEILDPITLSGRKNYLGHQYYLEVMGYDFHQRKELVKSFFEATSSGMIARMRQEHISYLVIPQKSQIDFPYHIDREFFEKNLSKVYQDDVITVFKL